MNHTHRTLRAPGALALVGLSLLPGLGAASQSDHQNKGIHFISQSAMLAGLPASAVFPFIDVTPNRIRQAHVAITDATDDCGGLGTGVPSNVQILVGEAGGTLVPAMTDATNTGISVLPGQCVFHVTVRAGAGGFRSR